VAGASHRDYLVKLGFPSHRITTGFDVVDNNYFRSTALELRQNTRPCQRPFLLASNRFLPRKNLSTLLQAFAKARSCGCSWDLCLLGDGPDRSLLQREADQLGLWLQENAPWDSQRPSPASPGVFLPGFRQINELPQFYARASAFIHPALSEPWGLVINEAMAAGLPILSSANVGAAEELVLDGRNGFRFDPLSAQAMAEAIVRLTALPAEQLAAMGEASAALIEQRCPLSAFGDGLHRLLCLPPR
jgi:glycosyltransferase involved in cell wall biosynthesis